MMKVIGRMLLLVALALTGCRSARQVTPGAAARLTDRDSVREVYVERVMIDTVAVEVAVPAESARQMVRDSVSFLETGVAESWAWVNGDGSLGHSLVNKAASIVTRAFVPRIETTMGVEAIREREVGVPAPYPVEVERELTAAEQMKLASWWYMAVALGVAAGWIFRRPLLRLLRKV